MVIIPFMVCLNSAPDSRTHIYIYNINLLIPNYQLVMSSNDQLPMDVRSC